ncbi:hypothetical protein TNCV_3051621 [Trichonephila clavipes]|nr:hypothetical protein TNCV_3051621 [Trichonephila clavipes]
MEMSAFVPLHGGSLVALGFELGIQQCRPRTCDHDYSATTAALSRERDEALGPVGQCLGRVCENAGLSRMR